MPNSEESLGLPASSSQHIPKRLGRGAKRPIRILIADGNPLSREGLRALLQRERVFQVVGQAASGEAAIAAVMQFQPHVLLLDMTIPQMGGIDVLRRLAATALPVRVLMLTADIARNETVQALNLGVSGFVLKNSPSTLLFEGIQRVMEGGHWISPDCIANLVERLRHTPPRVTPKNGKFGLTARELEVIIEVVAGCSNPEIAGKLSLSEQTVKHHLTHVFDKLGVYSRVELALFATNHNLCGAGADDVSK